MFVGFERLECREREREGETDREMNVLRFLQIVWMIVLLRKATRLIVVDI